MATLVAGCGDDPAGADETPLALPPVLILNGAAEGQLADGRSASCTLFLHIELEDDGTKEGGALVYRATAGGDAMRTVVDSTGAGFMFWPHLHSGATVRVDADSLVVEADGRDATTERFYREIMLLRGARTGRAEANGDWTCAPLDLDSNGWLDTSGIAVGTWTLAEGEE